MHADRRILRARESQRRPADTQEEENIFLLDGDKKCKIKIDLQNLRLDLWNERQALSDDFQSSSQL